MFEQAHEALETELGKGQAPTTESTPATTDTQSAGSATDAQIQAILDLDKAEKIRMDGKEMTMKELKDSIMFQRDYTKKTQALAKEREYADNLDADLQAIGDNPELLEKFKQIYPAKYHSVADRVARYASPSQETQVSAAPQGSDPELLKRIAMIEANNKRLLNDVETRELSAINSKLDSMASDMAKKYGLDKEDKEIVEELVTARADVLLSRGEKLTDQAFSTLWKGAVEKYQSLQKGYYAKEIAKQKQASAKARDAGPGGGVPGQAPKKETIREATERYAREISGRQ